MSAALADVDDGRAARGASRMALGRARASPTDGARRDAVRAAGESASPSPARSPRSPTSC